MTAFIPHFSSVINIIRRHIKRVPSLFNRPSFCNVPESIYRPNPTTKSFKL